MANEKVRRVESTSDSKCTKTHSHTHAHDGRIYRKLLSIDMNSILIDCQINVVEQVIYQIIQST